MTRNGGRIFVLWLLAMLAGASIVWHSRFSADMSFVLPARPTPAQQVLIEQLKEGAVSRLLMLAIEGGDAGQRAAVSRALRARLAERSEFVSVQNGEAGSIDAVRDFLLQHRYQLSPAVTPGRFTVDGLKAAVANSVDLLASPAGMMLKPYLTRDPTGEMMELLSGLNAGAQPAMQAGVWASRDGQRAMLLVQTQALGSDTDGQQQAIARVREEFAAAAQGAGITGLQLQLSGPGLFAVQARETIKAEISRLSLISTVAIIAILFVVYRSPRLMLLGMLPVASATLAGIVAVSLVFGTVFGITVGFGSALIGEAVDYAIYYFVQSGRLGLDNWRQHFWPTVRLGVLTSACGFGALLFSGFPGLAQLGVYALTGVLTAAVVTRFVLPSLAGPHLEVPPPGRAGVLLQTALRWAPKLRWPALALALVACGYLLTERGHLWSPNLSALSTVSASEARLDSSLRADLDAPDARYMVVVTAPTREAALQSAEAAGRGLDSLVAQGVIGGYDSPARFLPSSAAQAARHASLPSAQELRPRLQAALADSPLPASRLGPFLADIDAARQLPPVGREDLNGSPLALAVDALLLPRPGGWSVLLPLRPAGEAGASIPADAVRAAVAGSGALFIDMKGEFEALYGSYLDEAMALSAAGLLAIVALLAVTLRAPRRLAGVLLPLVLAVTIVLAGLHLAGTALHLLHLVGLLLIVAVGSNYALFFDRLATGEGLDDATLLAMAVAATTTVVGFGTLALSSVPVLHAIGVTVGPGATLALLLSAAFAPRAKAA